ncbi:MAG TPA: hypothetical protein VIM55_10135 [Mucilaginibacter sp.]
MDKAINFYELKQELADLGFTDPQVIDDLRSAVFLENEEQRIATQAFDVAFDLDLIRDERGRLTFLAYTGSLGAGTDNWQLQTFQPNVHAGAAAELLQARATRTVDTEDLSFMPLDPKAVQKEIRTIHMQNMTITQETAEQFAGFVEESLTYGQQWFTYELEENGQVKADSWYAFSKRQAADEDAEIIRPFAHSAKAEDLLPELYRHIDQQTTSIYLQKSNTMNNENLSYLQKQLLNMGFGEKLNEDLEKNIKAKATEFVLPTTLEYNQQSVDYNLHFKAGEQNDMYFFNKYDAKMPDKNLEHTFYINRGNGVTAKEAYNLLEGRSVHKQLENLENEKYNAWLIIENGKLRTFNDKWNYHPEKAIDKMDIVGIGEPGAKEKLMKSLEKGNRHQVTAMKNGKEVKLFIEANPAEHRVNLTNWKGEAQQLEHYKKAELKQDKKQAEKPAEKQTTDDTKKKRTRQAKVTV